MDEPLSFKAFLSHRYKAPTVNRYFFGIFDEGAEVQFEVDDGKFATNVTRLERMIRDCDAFIGIYPFSGGAAAPKREELLHESRYFRLELDLAIRARKPGLIFYDKRYRQLLKCPAFIQSVQFDSLEIDSPGGSPSAGLYRRTFRSFCERVATWKEYEIAAGAESGRGEGVVIVLPIGPRRTGGYSARELGLITSVLASNDYDEPLSLRWPPVLNAETLTALRNADWVLTDVGHLGRSSGVAAYLHGSFVPTMRLLHTARELDLADSLDFLYGGIEVGYRKDIISWSGARSLEEGLNQRLLSLDIPVRRINTPAEADQYFRSAALRKEAVFLSYSGRDQDAAAELSAALRERFQTVFDYRDGESIRPGKPWLEEIFTQLSTSAIGIPLLSAAYVESGNCLHEMREMVARRDAKSMAVIPLKVDRELGDVPSFASDTQYLRRWEYDRADDVVGAILEALA
jgi:TIR domain-containing protein